MKRSLTSYLAPTLQRRLLLMSQGTSIKLFKLEPKFAEPYFLVARRLFHFPAPYIHTPHFQLKRPHLSEWLVKHSGLDTKLYIATSSLHPLSERKLISACQPACRDVIPQTMIVTEQILTAYSRLTEFFLGAYRSILTSRYRSTGALWANNERPAKHIGRRSQQRPS